jgi:hypothetical protein
MSLSGDATRRLITVVLEKAQTFGLDVAGSFLGPAWPFVKPLVQALIDGLPAHVAKNWKNSADLLEEAEAKLRKQEELVSQIGEALEKNGITEAWALSVSEKLDHVSDDIFAVLCNQAAESEDRQAMKATLDRLLGIVTEQQERRPANVRVRGAEIEFVDLVRVPEDFLAGYTLVPSDFAIDSVKQNHMPAGFLIWSFSLWNVGEQDAVVKRIELQVTAQGACPDGSRYDQLLPTLDPFDDRVRLEAGQSRYRLFTGKKFSYAPDEHDDFRVQMTFVSDGPPLWQQLMPVVSWSDRTGDHTTYAPEIFLASHPAPQIERARAKFGLGRG